MKGKIRIIRRLTSGDIRDEAVQEQRLANMEQQREIQAMLVQVGIGVAVFVAVAIVSILWRLAQ